MKKRSLARPVLRGFAALVCVSLPLALPAQSAPPGAGAQGRAVPPPMPPEVQRAAESYSRAVALDKAHKVPEAIGAYEAFVRLASAAHLPASSIVEVEGRLTFLYQLRGDQKKVETNLLRIIALDPKSPIAYAQLASLYSQQGKLDRAKAYAMQAVARKPPRALAALVHHVLGAAAIMKGDSADAEKEFALSIEAAPRAAQGYMDYAFALMQRKKTAEALVAARRAEALSPTLVQPKLMLAGIYQEQNRLSDALSEYETVLRAEPRNRIALYNRAAVLHRQGNVQEAISAYLLALEVMPASYDAHYNIAQLYFAIQNYQAARQHYAEAHILAPKDPRSLASLALAEQKEAAVQVNGTERRNELALAEGHLKEAEGLAPKDASLQMALAGLYEDLGRTDAAVAIYRKRVEANPKDGDAYRRIAIAYTRQRKMDEVVKIWREYRAQDPRNPLSYQEAADVLEKTGQLARAVDEWKALLATKPRGGVTANALNNEAGDLVKLKRTDEARAGYSAVLALDSTGAYAPKSLQAVESAAVKSERLTAWRGLAALAEQENRPAEAIADWEHVKGEEAPLAARNGHYDSEPYLKISRIYEQQQKAEQAAAEIKALLAVTPKDSTAYAELARLYEGQHKTDEAIAAYRQAALYSATPVQDRLRVAQAFQRFNQPDKAIAEYQAIRRQAPRDISVLTALALALRQAGRDAESLEAYDTISKIDPRLTWVHDYKAIALVHLKRFPEARALYVAQLDRSPRSRQTYADLANVYREEGKPDDFLAWLAPRFARTPGNPVLMSVLLDEYVRQKRADDGFTAIKQVVDQHKTQRPVLQAYAELLIERGRRAEAVEVYRRLAALAPKDIDAQLTLADQLDGNLQKEEAAKLYQALIARPELTPEQRLSLHRKFAQRSVLQGDSDEAIRQYQEVVKGDPADFEAASELALTLVAAKRENEAVPYYVKLSAVRAYPAEVRADIFSKLGDIYAKQGRKPEAIAQYHEALKLNPRDPGAAEGLRRLGEK